MTTHNEEDDAFLDDVLDEFAQPSAAPVPAAAVTSSSNTQQESKATADPEDALFDDDFQKQLAAGMEQLMKEFAAGAGGEDGGAGDAAASGSSAAGGKDAEVTMQQLMASIQQLQMGFKQETVEKGKSVASTTATTTTTTTTSFQSQIQETMHKLRDSSEKVEAQVTDAAGPGGFPFMPGMDDANMEQMMKELEGMMGTSDFENMFSGMMEQLMSRDLLYEPIKDLAEKYPTWLEENEASTNAEDLERYRKQYDVIKQIQAVYDQGLPSEEEGKKVVELMQKMQECGNPPEALLQDLAPGMEMGPDGMPKLPPNLAGNGQDCVVM